MLENENNSCACNTGYVEYKKLQFHLDRNLAVMEYPYYHNSIDEHATHQCIAFGIHLFLHTLRKNGAVTDNSLMQQYLNVIFANAYYVKEFLEMRLNIYDDYFRRNNKRDICGNLINHYISDVNLIINCIENLKEKCSLYHFLKCNIDEKLVVFSNQIKISNEKYIHEKCIMGFTSILLELYNFINARFFNLIPALIRTYNEDLVKYFKHHSLRV